MAAQDEAILDWHSGVRRWLRAWGISFLVWTALWAYLLSPTLFGFRQWEKPISLWDLLPYLTDHWASALLTPIFLVVAWRYPLDRRRRWRSLLPLLGALALFSALDDLLVLAFRYGWLHYGVIDKLIAAPHVKSALLTMYVRTVFNYAQIVAVGWALHYQREARFREVQASQLEARLTQARLDVLRMQIHPHFLFNTLNSIAALMHSDLAAADRMIARLAELLRQSLDGPTGQESSVKEELDLTQRYLDIERVRFGDRLVVTVRADPAALDARVPRLILQPLVENAVRHGIAARMAGGSIDIDVRCEAAQLVLRVVDDGTGLDRASPAPAGSGLGLSNTRTRLEALYGADGRLELAPRPEGGTAATVRLPLRPWATETGPSPGLRAGRVLENGETPATAATY